MADSRKSTSQKLGSPANQLQQDHVLATP
jgi:hypothetical protein